MSSPSGSSNPSKDEVTEVALEVLQYFETAQVTQYMGMAILALMFYEYLITFDLEVRYIWGRRLTWAKVIFFLNRYLAPLQSLGLVLPVILPASQFVRGCLVSTDCVTLNMFQRVVTLLQFVVWAAFAGLRMYPVSGSNIFLTLAAVLLSLFPAGTNIAAIAVLQLGVSSIPLAPHPPFCFSHGNMSSSEFHQLGMLTNVPYIIAEGMIIAVILLRTATVVRGRTGFSMFKFTQLIVRDGIVYFTMMMFINVVAVGTYFTDSTPYADFCVMIGILMPLTISRYYFNLAGLSDAEEKAKVPSRWEAVASLSLPVGTVAEQQEC